MAGTSEATGQEQTPGTGATVGAFQGQGEAQTQAGAPDAGAGNGKPAEGEGSGAGGADDGQTPGAGDGEGNYAHPESGAKISADELIEYYKGQFSASASGANTLLETNKTLTSEIDQSKGTIADLTKKIADLTAIAEGKNPSGLEASKLQEQLAEATKEIALIKENSLLDSFEKTVPLAAGKRDSLKTLARANPSKSLQELWDSNLKAGAEAEEAKRVADEKARKEGAGDKGKGTSTREPAGGGDTVKGPKGDSGMTLEEINKLPVVERGKIFAKIGL